MLKFVYFTNSKRRAAAIFEIENLQYLRNRSTDRNKILQEHAHSHCRPYRKWKFAYLRNSKWRTAAILEIKKPRYLHNRSTDRDKILCTCVDFGGMLKFVYIWQIQHTGRSLYWKSKIRNISATVQLIEAKFCRNMQIAVVNRAESKKMHKCICTNIAKKHWSVLF